MISHSLFVASRTLGLVTVIICPHLPPCAYLHRALGKVGVEGDAHAAVVVPRARFGLLYGLLYGGYDDDTVNGGAGDDRLRGGSFFWDFL